MKASRRKFFGFMGGAAVAGLAAAKSVVEPLVSAGMAVPMAGGYGGYGDVAKASASEPNRAARIAELVKRLAGFRTKAEIEQDRVNRIENAAEIFRYEVDALRSVSMRHKVSMIRTRNRAVSEIRQRSWWEQDLANLRGEAE